MASCATEETVEEHHRGCREEGAGRRVDVVEDLEPGQQVQREAAVVDARDGPQQHEAAAKRVPLIFAPCAHGERAAHQGSQHVDDGVHGINLPPSGLVVWPEQRDNQPNVTLPTSQHQSTPQRRPPRGATACPRQARLGRWWTRRAAVLGGAEFHWTSPSVPCSCTAAAGRAARSDQRDKSSSHQPRACACTEAVVRSQRS